MEWILVIILVLVLVGVLPIFPYSRSWGFIPGGVVGLLMMILVIVLIIRLI